MILTEIRIFIDIHFIDPKIVEGSVFGNGSIIAAIICVVAGSMFEPHFLKNRTRSFRVTLHIIKTN